MFPFTTASCIAPEMLNSVVFTVMLYPMTAPL